MTLIGVSHHDLERLRFPGVFILLAPPEPTTAAPGACPAKPRRSRVLAAGQGDPVARGLTTAALAQAIAAGCTEAIVHPCPCPRRRDALTQAILAL